MSYRSLMVHVELDPSNDSRLTVAGMLAASFDASLIGIAAADPNPPAYGGSGLAAGLVVQEKERIHAQMAQAEKRFRAATAGNAPRIEWRQGFDKPNIFLARESRAADVVIIGPNRAGAVRDPFHVLDADILIMHAGRPILLVPSETETLSVKTVVVGWKDTREARRAIWDALPLLGRAEYVVVAEVSEQGDAPAVRTRTDDVAKWLTSHGVAAIGRAVKGDDAAKLLPELASEESADLIVSGAYGHSRMQEWIWGGVTRSLLTTARCCCLLAH
jgi:nucleotide-binding universal stress UspA family protein